MTTEPRTPGCVYWLRSAEGRSWGADVPGATAAFAELARLGAGVGVIRFATEPHPVPKEAS